MKLKITHHPTRCRIRSLLVLQRGRSNPALLTFPSRILEEVCGNRDSQETLRVPQSGKDEAETSRIGPLKDTERP